MTAVLAASNPGLVVAFAAGEEAAEEDSEAPRTALLAWLHASPPGHNVNNVL